MTSRLTFPFPEGPAAEPPAEYRRLRERCPLAPVSLSNGVDAFLVTRHQDVRQVLSDPRFSRAAFAERGLFARERSSLALVASDPPEHTRRRGAAARAFTARQARQSREDVEQVARQLLQRMRAVGPPADLVAAFAVPLPLTVMCRLLGIPAEDKPEFLPWVEAMMSTSRHSPRVVAQAHADMHRHFLDLVAAKQEAVRRGTPPSGLLGEFLLATGDSGSISHEEVAVLGAGLLIAGYETTSNQLATCAYLLLRNRGLAERLRACPSDIPAAVEEMLRWTAFTTTGGIPHVALEDVPLAGTTVRAGQVVVPVTDAANRDPAVFDRPDELVTDRAPNPHLAFGHGRHYCLGAQLARIELDVAVRELLRGLPGVELAVAEPELDWRRGMFIRGLWRLPVRWTAERNDVP